MTVKLELSRRVVKGGMTPEDAAGSLVGASMHALGTSVKTRVQSHGDLGGQSFPGWRQRGRRRYAVSPRYPDRAQGQVGPSGAEWFESRPAYQRENATRAGTYATTGGMWSGLSIVMVGRFRAELRFRGRSEGANPNFTRRPAKGSGRTRIIARPLKINNTLKAATVLRQHGINVLAPTDGELERVNVIVVDLLGLGMSRLGVTWDRPLTAPSIARTLPEVSS